MQKTAGNITSTAATTVGFTPPPFEVELDSTCDHDDAITVKASNTVTMDQREGAEAALRSYVRGIRTDQILTDLLLLGELVDAERNRQTDQATTLHAFLASRMAGDEHPGPGADNSYEQLLVYVRIIFADTEQWRQFCISLLPQPLLGAAAPHPQHDPAPPVDEIGAAGEASSGGSPLTGETGETATGPTDSAQGPVLKRTKGDDDLRRDASRSQDSVQQQDASSQTTVGMPLSSDGGSS